MTYPVSLSHSCAVLMETDAHYCWNMRALNRRELSGKIEQHMAVNIRRWLRRKAERRACTTIEQRNSKPRHARA